MTPLIIANWKMNVTLQESEDLCNILAAKSPVPNLLISPPVPYLAYLASKFQMLSFVAPNVSLLPGKGSYSGEYSATIIKSCAVSYALIGHSERRALGESNAVIAQKVANCCDAGVTPILCIGESLEVREQGMQFEFLKQQLKESLPASFRAQSELIVAYEPVWSIGTGIVATPEVLAQTLNMISSYLEERVVAKTLRLVYGGSVNLSNISEILRMQFGKHKTKIDGCLIGTASLDSQALSQMLQISNTLLV